MLSGLKSDWSTETDARVRRWASPRRGPKTVVRASATKFKMTQVDTMKAQMRNMQMQCVEMFAKGKGLIPKEQLNDEIDWFFQY